MYNCCTKCSNMGSSEYLCQNCVNQRIAELEAELADAKIRHRIQNKIQFDLEAENQRLESVVLCAYRAHCTPSSPFSKTVAHTMLTEWAKENDRKATAKAKESE